MELIPTLQSGWLNGWTLVCLLYLIYGAFLLTLPQDVRARLFYYDRTRWSRKQRAFYVMGKASVLFYLALVTLTPLKKRKPCFHSWDYSICNGFGWIHWRTFRF